MGRIFKAISLRIKLLYNSMGGAIVFMESVFCGGCITSPYLGKIIQLMYIA